MKKLLCLSLIMVLMLSSTILVSAQEAKPNDDEYLSISDYNNTYQQAESEDLLSLDSYNQKYSNENLLSLDDYNKEYSNEDLLSLDDYNQKYSNETDSEQYSENATNPLDTSSKATRSLSVVQTQTKSIYLHTNNANVGSITLQYQTDIVSGRPQFQYSTCYLSTPNITTYWKMDNSYVEFSGDLIRVYFHFSYGDFSDYAWVSFTP